MESIAAYSCWFGCLAGGSLLLWTVRRELSAPSCLFPLTPQRPVKIVQFDDAGKNLAW